MFSRKGFVRSLWTYLCGHCPYSEVKGDPQCDTSNRVVFETLQDVSVRQIELRKFQ